MSDVEVDQSLWRHKPPQKRIDNNHFPLQECHNSTRIILIDMNRYYLSEQYVQQAVHGFARGPNISRTSVELEALRQDRRVLTARVEGHAAELRVIRRNVESENQTIIRELEQKLDASRKKTSNLEQAVEEKRQKVSKLEKETSQMIKLKADLERTEKKDKRKLSTIKALRQELEEAKTKAESLEQEKASLIFERDSALSDAAAKERVVKAAEHVTKCNAGKHWEEYGRRMAALKEAINGDEE